MDYYDDSGSYYYWYQRKKDFERLRKIKKKKQEKADRKLLKEKIKIENKQKRAEEKERLKREKIETKAKNLEEMKVYGYKPTWTKQNPLKRAKNSRDLTLCKEIYEKAKSGISSFNLAKEYNMHPNSILRYKYEYEYYLALKGLDKDVDI